MIYGYIRVSTEQQHLENQTHEINTFVDSLKKGIYLLLQNFPDWEGIF